MESSIKELRFPLSKNLVRPFFAYDTGSETVTFLFDTGANIPVWCSGADLLKDAFPDAEQTDYRIEIHGFGKQYEVGTIYKLPLFSLQSGRVHYRLHNLYFALLEKPTIGCDFLICPRMFEKSDYLITNRGKKEILFISDREDYYCTPMMKADGTFEKFVVWEQESITLEN